MVGEAGGQETRGFGSGNAVLVLADGTVFRGEGIGRAGTASGEVVFNTSMTGYQEVFTDPSYRGQVVAMTCPHIGNVGANERDDERAGGWGAAGRGRPIEDRPALSGVVLRSASAAPSNWRAQVDLGGWLDRLGIVGITGVDVRALTRRIRERGAIPGVLSWPVTDRDMPRLREEARACPPLSGRDLAREVTCREPYRYGAHPPASADPLEPSGDAWVARPGARRGTAVVVDFGAKRSILDCLWSAGFDVEVVPATTPAHDILVREPALVVLSNGPGDPEPVTYGVETARTLLGRVRLFGICLGHQVLGLALGARTYKLRFGHHGGNHPVRDLRTGRVLITAQNHGFAVEASSLPAGAAVTFQSLNDGTLEGFDLADLRVRAVQFHPEAGPGPHDARFLFEEAW